MASFSNSVFKSLCSDVLEPSGVKVGGYKDELFLDLTNEERDKLECKICYLVIKDPQQCKNKHLFCGSCIFAWSMTSDNNADRCPMCRVRGAYEVNEEMANMLNAKKVKCSRAGCHWTGLLADYRSHDHGLEDAGVDPKNTYLPTIRNRSGDDSFPHLNNSGNLELDVMQERSQREVNLILLQTRLSQGRARLSYLMDLFESELRRRRHNLNSLSRLQARFTREQMQEVMHIESELGQITANLLQLVETTANDVARISTQLSTEYPDAEISTTAFSNTRNSTIANQSTHLLRRRMTENHQNRSQNQSTTSERSRTVNSTSLFHNDARNNRADRNISGNNSSSTNTSTSTITNTSTNTGTSTSVSTSSGASTSVSTSSLPEGNSSQSQILPVTTTRPSAPLTNRPQMISNRLRQHSRNSEPTVQQAPASELAHSQTVLPRLTSHNASEPSQQSPVSNQTRNEQVDPPQCRHGHLNNRLHSPRRDVETRGSTNERTEVRPIQLTHRSLLGNRGTSQTPRNPYEITWPPTAR